MTTSSRARILFLAHRPLTEASYGGGQRTTHIRSAAAEVGEVDTLVVTAAQSCYASDWDNDRTRTLTYRDNAGLLSGVRDRLRVRRWVRATLASSTYDVVIARYLSTALTVPRRYRSRMVFDADDVLKTPDPSRGLAGSAAHLVRAALVHRLLGQVRHVWFVSPRDMDRLGSWGRSQSLLVNAAIVHGGRQGSRERNTLVVVGHHSHAPNREAVEFLLSEVMPELRRRRPDVRLRVIGSVPDECRRRWSAVPNVDVLGFVDDLRAEYDRAASAVAPVRTGGGTQIKVIEALANGCPVITSPFAHSGFSEILRAGRHLYVADSAQDWVDTCVGALDDPDGSQAMAQAAREIVRSRYGVDDMKKHVRTTLAPLIVPAGQPDAPRSHSRPLAGFPPSSR